MELAKSLITRLQYWEVLQILEGVNSFQAKIIGSALTFTPGVLSFMAISFKQGILAIAIAAVTAIAIGIQLKSNW